ncbi:transcriptional regulator, XRE family [Halovenus aranensis]|jgi:putative transcriptional regulator|uniref:Transcriptional regulator, XRE family n=1 Tax=Halovenus aranensis TaxID=890420 RepID=A0A1G8TGK5_9EURY|nr:helix-turn-helix domain-containing protein [Halovenus aranensis]SDJ40686.1 transcriptional regulator, XRE family [Halovenus aranensis]
MARGAREQLAEKIAGEVTLSDDPGATLKKWRVDFEIAQTDLADALDISPSVISDYESGRRENPGIDIIQRSIAALLDIDERRGGKHIHQYTRVLSAGFDSDVVLDLREYPANIPLDRYYEAIGATELVGGNRDAVAGHTVIDSIEAIRRLSSDDFYSLYGESTNRALVFTNVTRGESPLVAQRVIKPTPHVVVLHGIEPDEVWEYATDLARADTFALAVSNVDQEELLDGHRNLP